jgi:predicted acetyltransferase
VGWLVDAENDFAGFVAATRGVRTRWGVPSTIFWYCARADYLGTLVVRHELTPELLMVGGHIGYHVVSPWQRQGHATRMLAEGLGECERMGIEQVLLTCAVDNQPSRKVILANGGIHEDERQGEDRFWIDLRHGAHR